MPPRRRIDRKCLSSRKLSLSKRFSNTPKKSTPSKKIKSNDVDNCEFVQSPELKNLSKSSSRARLNVSGKLTDNCLNVSEILKVNWRVFRVSPIYNFDENKLKIYGRKLKEELATANCRSESAGYKCKFFFQTLSLQQKYDVIQVSLTAVGSKYIGFYISSADDQSKEKFTNIKHFPVLLVQAEGKTLKQVHNVFCKLFDCDIHPVNFSFEALVTFFSSHSYMYTKDVPKLSSQTVSLHFKIPDCAPTNSIAVTLSLAATSTVFAVLNQEFGKTLDSNNLITCFYSWIINHILNTYQVDLSPAELFKIVFPHFAVSSEGWVKFSSEEAVNNILPIIEDFIKLDHITNP